MQAKDNALATSFQGERPCVKKKRIWSKGFSAHIVLQFYENKIKAEILLLSLLFFFFLPILNFLCLTASEISVVITSLKHVFLGLMTH